MTTSVANENRTRLTDGFRFTTTTYVGSNGTLFNATAEGVRYYQTQED